jgi:hypothetical protein
MKEKFIEDNKGIGYLNIRTSFANSALPVSGVRIVISKTIDNEKVIFYEGITDEVGSISNIKLNTKLDSNNNMVEPVATDYDIEAFYNNQSLYFNVKMYPNIKVLQNINIVPSQEVI